MKLRKILNEDYSVDKLFELSPPKNVNELKINICKILYDMSSRKMAFVYIQEHLKLYSQISKQFLNEIKIDTLSDFEKYINKLHIKVRSGIKNKKMIDKQNSAFKMFMYKIFYDTGIQMDDDL